MEGSDPRRAVATGYISHALKLLRAARSGDLDHSDAATVTIVLDCLGVVERSMARAAPADAQIAIRLRWLALEIKSCVEPGASIAHAPLDIAAAIFQAIADGL